MVDVTKALDKYGEIIVVLDSGVEYELHKHDTEVDGSTVVTKGMKGGEYLEAVFDKSTVEHYYTHYES